MKKYLHMLIVLLLALALMAGCGSSYFKKNNVLFSMISFLHNKCIFVKIYNSIIPHF